MKPPVKKISMSLRGSTVFSNVLPNTNRKSMFPNRCKTLAWTNRATTRVQTLPFSRLSKLKIRFLWANSGSCCHAQMLAATQASISSELTFKAKIPYQEIVPPFEKSVLHTVTQAFYPIPLSLAHRVDRRILNDCLLRKILVFRFARRPWFSARTVSARCGVAA